MKNKVLTGIKFILQTSDEQKKILDEYYNNYRKLFNIISNYVYYHYILSSGKYDTSKIDREFFANGHKGKKPTASAQLRLSDILKTDIFSDEFDKYNFGSEGIRRNITHQVTNRYKGYYKRNGQKPPKPITMDDGRGITYYNKLVSYNDKTLNIKVPHTKDKNIILKIAYYIPQSMRQYVKYLPKTFGGTLDKRIDTYVFVALADKHWESSYEPVDWVGYDIGKHTFLYFSDNIWDSSDTIPHSDKLIQVRIKINELLKNIGRKDIKSSYRSLFRRQWLNAQAKHIQILKPIAQKIIDWAKTNKLGLALDGAKFGGKMGSAGQEITDILKDLAVKEFVPFYVPATPYQSQKCSVCGHVHKKNRKGEAFLCLNCGHTDNADKNAAINHKKAAVKWYKDSLVP